MRINIVIDDALMETAMQASQLRTKRETVELALQTLIQLRQQEDLRQWRGKLRWEGDLESMRLDHQPSPGRQP